MTYDELIKALSENTGLSAKDCKTVLATVPEVLAANLSAGAKVITPLGTFRQVTRASRQVRNIKTGVLMQTKEKRVITLKPGKGLLQATEA